jgi:uncharacterized protein
MKPVLLDTGVIVALLDRSERRHAQCAAAVAELERPLVTCEAVIAESCYLLRRLSGAAEAVFENVARGFSSFHFSFRAQRLQCEALCASIGTSLPILPTPA